jgi:hypothetical protein
MNLLSFLVLSFFRLLPLIFSISSLQAKLQLFKFIVWVFIPFIVSIFFLFLFFEFILLSLSQFYLFIIFLVSVWFLDLFSSVSILLTVFLSISLLHPPSAIFICILVISFFSFIVVLSIICVLLILFKQVLSFKTTP